MKYPALSVVPEIKKDLFIFFSIAVIFYLVAALYSTTFSNADQHFQTLEFADFKRTGTGEEALPWEYHRKIRSWIQPYLYVVILDFADAVGITNPINQDRLIRLITGAAAVTSLALFAVTMAWWLPLRGQRRLLIGMLALTWMFPWFFTRTSSEAWTSIFVLMALNTLFLLRRNPEPMSPTAPTGRPFVGRMDFTYEGLALSGICIALAFLFRYQTGPVFVVLGLWMLIAARTSVLKMSFFTAIVALTVGLGVGLDFLGYGSFELVPLNNVKANVVDGIASKFGVSPWHFYFTLPFTEPMGGVLIVVIVYYWIRFPLSLLTLMTAFFIVQHSFIPHKEIRFIFPLVPLVVVMVPFIFSKSWYGPEGRNVPLLSQAWPARILGYGLLAVNALGLWTETTRPVRPPIELHKLILSQQPEHFEFYSLGFNPYRCRKDTFGDYHLRMEFYSPNTFKHHILSAPSDIGTIRTSGTFYFLSTQRTFPQTPDWDAARDQCTQIGEPIQSGYCLRKKQSERSPERAYSLYECKSAASAD